MTRWLITLLILLVYIVTFATAVKADPVTPVRRDSTAAVLDGALFIWKCINPNTQVFQGWCPDDAQDYAPCQAYCNATFGGH